MDVEQALKDAESGRRYNDQYWAKVANTLAAEVRRLAGAVPAGHVRDEKGEDRRVLGKIPLTADGCVFGVNPGTVYHIADGEVLELEVEDETDEVAIDMTDDFELVDEDEMPTPLPPWECYSTRAAAEAAREGRGT